MDDAGARHTPVTSARPTHETPRDLATLPKAHLHLHFTGSLSVPNLVELAAERQIELPEQLIDAVALEVPADKRGWFRFQRFYDVARAAVKGEDALRTVVARAQAGDAHDVRCNEAHEADAAGGGDGEQSQVRARAAELPA